MDNTGCPSHGENLGIKQITIYDNPNNIYRVAASDIIFPVYFQVKKLYYTSYVCMATKERYFAGLVTSLVIIFG